MHYFYQVLKAYFDLQRFCGCKTVSPLTEFSVNPRFFRTSAGIAFLSQPIKAGDAEEIPLGICSNYGFTEVPFSKQSAVLNTEPFSAFSRKFFNGDRHTESVCALPAPGTKHLVFVDRERTASVLHKYAASLPSAEFEIGTLQTVHRYRSTLISQTIKEGSRVYAFRASDRVPFSGKFKEATEFSPWTVSSVYRDPGDSAGEDFADIVFDAVPTVRITVPVSELVPFIEKMD